MSRTVLHGVILDDEETLSAAELVRACGADAVHVEAWIAEGVIEPRERGDGGPAAWRFAGSSLARTRLAMRLGRDLALNPPGVALALELLDRIAALESRIRSR